MKILAVSDYYPPFTKGGAEVALQASNEALSKKGIQVSVLTTYPGSQACSSLPRGVFWVKRPRSRTPIAKAVTDYLVYLRMAVQIARLVRRTRYDVVHAVNGDSAIAVMIAKWLSPLPRTILSEVSYIHICPYGDILNSTNGKECSSLSHLVTCSSSRGTGLPLQVPAAVRLLLKQHLMARAMKGFDTVLPVSDYVGEVTRLSFGASCPRLVRMYLAAAEDSHSTHPSITSRNRQVMFAGRLTTEKGFDVFLDSLPTILTVPGSSVVVCGEGPLMKDAQRAADNWPGRVTLKGFVPNTEVRDLMRDSRVVAVPSVWPEPLGLTAMEGMREGAVVAASRVGGLPEVVADCGVLVSPGKADELGEKIAWALRDDEAAERYSNAGQERMKVEFGLEKVVKNLEALYFGSV